MKGKIKDLFEQFCDSPLTNSRPSESIFFALYNFMDSTSSVFSMGIKQPFRNFPPKTSTVATELLKLFVKKIKEEM